MRRRRSARARRLTEVVAFSLFGAATVAGLFALGIILYYIISRGGRCPLLGVPDRPSPAKG